MLRGINLLEGGNHGNKHTHTFKIVCFIPLRRVCLEVAGMFRPAAVTGHYMGRLSGELYLAGCWVITMWSESQVASLMTP